MGECPVVKRCEGHWIGSAVGVQSVHHFTYERMRFYEILDLICRILSAGAALCRSAHRSDLLHLRRRRHAGYYYK